MRIQSERTLDRLCSEQQCLGVVCSTYAFDPQFFEEQFLRTILRLGSDPVEQPQRYHAEAIRSLQETPVAVFVDAGQRQPGRRLPYDLIEIHKVAFRAKAAFHPKSVLLLYEQYARLMIGSGNLTSAGYGQNTELFIALDLRYDNEQDTALLKQFDAHLQRINKLAQHSGSQFALVREMLQRRLDAVVSSPDSAEYVLLDSTTEPFVEQIMNLLPVSAKIDRVEMLAPFYELDDGGELDSSSVFGALRSRAAKDVSLDVAVRWENSQVMPDAKRTDLADGFGRLWAWKSGDKGEVSIEYLVPTAITRSTMKYTDHGGASRKWNLQGALEAIEDGDFWMLPKPQAFAPKKSLKAAKEKYSDVRLWLHPATRLIDGRVISRPLHAKLLLVGFRSGNTKRTMVVMGSANMSRRALLQNTANGGNAELGIGFVVNEALTLTDFLPELVSVPMSLLDLNEREFPDAGTNWSIAIAEAVHDPAERTLKIVWSDRAVELPPWQLLYQETQLAAADAAPVDSLLVTDFTLQPATAEIILRVSGQDFSVPILVTDLIALPVVVGGNSLGLNDLLLLLARRIGTEQAIHRAQNRVGRDSTDLDALFGEGFTPTDVFRAWWSVADDLQDPSLSVPAFRLLLEGSLSAGYAWKCMLDSLPSEQMDQVEVWFYGAELLRELVRIELTDSPDREAKLSLLDAFKKRIQSDLSAIAPAGTDVKWLKTIQRFYSGANQ